MYEDFRHERFQTSACSTALRSVSPFPTAARELISASISRSISCGEEDQSLEAMDRTFAIRRCRHFDWRQLPRYDCHSQRRPHRPDRHHFAGGRIDPVSRACAPVTKRRAMACISTNPRNAQPPKSRARSSWTRELPAFSTVPSALSKRQCRTLTDSVAPSRARSSARRQEAGSPNRAICSEAPTIA